MDALKDVVCPLLFAALLSPGVAGGAEICGSGRALGSVRAPQYVVERVD